MGVPIEDVINDFYSEGYLIDWFDFYIVAINKGWSKKTILDKIFYGFEESNYRDLSFNIMNRLNSF